MANIAELVAAVVARFPQAQQEAANALLARVPESQRPADGKAAWSGTRREAAKA